MKFGSSSKTKNAIVLWIVLVSAIFIRICAPAAQNDSPAANSQSETNATDFLRSNLQLQEQLRRVQLSIEESRQQSEAAAASTAQSIANRLQVLEKTLAMERERDIDAVRSSTRVMWIVASTFGIVGILGILLMAYQWRTVSHLAEVGLPAIPSFSTAPGHAHAAFGPDDRRLLGNGSVDQSSAQLVTALSLLEKRIQELEHTSTLATKQPPVSSPSSQVLPLGSIASSTSDSSPTNPVSIAPRIGVLLGKGQSLLNLDKPDEALVCFDEALAIEPEHGEALIKKAAALERLRNFPEAIACYDRAIAADTSFTMAYLHKGGLFNRMERYSEALECYELALKAQEKR